MAPSECYKCRRIVPWGSRTCPYCGCESPTSAGRTALRLTRRKQTQDTSDFSPSLISGWWWIVLFLLIAGTALFAYIYDFFDLGKYFGRISRW